MGFGKYFSQQLKFALCSSLAMGLVVGLVVLVTGGVEGAVTLDIDLGYSDAVWLLLGIPTVVIALFALVSPLAFLIHKVTFRTAQ